MVDRDRVIALVKLADDIVHGEQFQIIEVDDARNVRRSHGPVNLQTAETRLQSLGCDVWLIARLVRDARDAFNGLVGLDGIVNRGDDSEEGER
jgi:hypothetical protein